MKPLPALDNEAAMLRKGRESAIWTARREAMETLRDAYTAAQSDDWTQLGVSMSTVKEAAERLMLLSVMWDEL